MRKSVIMGALVIFLMASLAWGADERKRLAVIDFDFGTVQRWWEGNWDIGKGIADLIVTELVTDGTYRMIERKRLDAVLGEQDFNNSNRADPTTGSQIGKVLGVNAIVMGSITQFGTEEKKTGIGAIAGRFGGFGGAKVGTQKGKAKVAIDLRVVSSDTGEILAVAKGIGESKRSGFMLGGLGVGGGGFGAGGIEMGSSDFRETILGEAVTAAVADMTAQLIGLNDRIPAVKFDVSGLVADVSGNVLTLTVGSSHGVSQGDTLVVERVTRTIKNPATGEVIREVTEPVGTVRVNEVGDDYAVASVVTGSGFKVGDKVVSQ